MNSLDFDVNSTSEGINLIPTVLN